MAMLPPPGWKLLNPYMPGQSQSPFQVQVRQLGYWGLGASRVLPKRVAEHALVPAYAQIAHVVFPVAAAVRMVEPGRRRRNYSANP